MEEFDCGQKWWISISAVTQNGHRMKMEIGTSSIDWKTWAISSQNEKYSWMAKLTEMLLSANFLSRVTVQCAIRANRGSSVANLMNDLSATLNSRCFQEKKQLLQGKMWRNTVFFFSWVIFSGLLFCCHEILMQAFNWCNVIFLQI